MNDKNDRANMYSIIHYYKSIKYKIASYVWSIIL